MAKYVDLHLNKNEMIVQKAELNPVFLVCTWIAGILFFWLLLIPFIRAIIKTVQYCKLELAVTNKRMISKIGVFKTKTLDAPLNKIQNVSTNNNFWGKVFNYSTIVISMAAGQIKLSGVKNADVLKCQIMNQIEEYEVQRLKDQAAYIASAMAGVINK